MHAMEKALKTMHSIMLNQGETNAKLILTLEEAMKYKGANPSKEATKAMKIETTKSFMRMDTKAMKVR
jgi:hypothetical protein